MVDNSGEPEQIQTPVQYPTASRVEDGIAYDISGKKLGSVDVSAQPQVEPAQSGGFNFGFDSDSTPPAEKTQQNKSNEFDFGFEQGSTEKPSASTRFAGSTAEAVGMPADVRDIPSTIENLSRGPVGPEGGLHPANIPINLVKGVVEGSADASQQGLDRMKQPGYMNKVIGALEYVEGGIPFIGPSLVKGGRQLESGDIAGGVGTTAGAAAAIFLPGEAERIAAVDPKNVFQTNRQKLAAATKLHESSKTVFNQRMSEVDIASQQAEKAANDARIARQNELSGAGSPSETIQAQEKASQAAANARKAQEALKQAGAVRAEHGVEVDRLARKVQKSAASVTEKQTKAAAGAQEDFQKAIPSPANGPAKYSAKDYDVGRRYLEEHHQNIQQVGSVQDTYDAFDHIQQDMENKIKPYVEKYSNEPIQTNVKMDVRDALADNPRSDFVEDGMKALDAYNLTDPTIAEADEIRLQLNAENRATLKKNMWDVATALQVDPEFAAKYHAADSLRNGIYDTFEDKGIDGIREMRQDESSIIRLRNAADRQIVKGSVKVRGSGQSGNFRKAAAWGVKKGSILVGAKVGGPIGAGVGDTVGDKLGRAIAPGDLTRDQLIGRSMKHQGGGVPITEIQGVGAPPTPFELPGTVPQRENTPLHGELATHYGENFGKSSYHELEQRFMEDISDKQNHGVPLDPPEKTLLGKINQQNAADTLAAQQEEQDRIAAGKPQPGEVVLPDKVEPLLQSPGSKLAEGMDTERGIVHDMAHIVVGQERGINFRDGIRSHLHPENKSSGSLMSAPVDWEPFVDEDGNVDPQKLKTKIADIAATYVAGGVANDLYHDIPFTENHHLGADVSILKRFIKSAGFSEAEASKMIAQAADDAAQVLSRPGTQEVLQQHAAVREGGLDERYHVSPERMDQILADIKGRGNETTTGKPTGTTESGERPVKETGAGAKTSTEEGDTAELRPTRKGPPEGEGGAVRKDNGGAEPSAKTSEPELSADDELKSTYQVYDPKTGDVISEHTTSKGARRKADKLDSEYGAVRYGVKEKPAAIRGQAAENPKLGTPPERSVGSPEHDQAIRDGGGIPGGVMGSLDEDHVKLFHDPETGSTLGIKSGEPVTADAVRQKLAESRAKFAAAKQNPVTPETAQKIADLHRDNGGSTYNPGKGNLAGTDNYAVAAHPERGAVLEHQPTAEDIQQFAEKNKDLLSNPDKSIGTWHDESNNTHALDVVHTIPDRDQAVALGEKNSQKAIFNLKNNEEIPTGGTGVPENPKLSIPDSELDKFLEEKSGYHPDLQAVIKTTRSLHTDPAKIKQSGTFITPDGKISNLGPGETHPGVIARSAGESYPSADNRPDFLDKTGAVRTRFTVARDGDRLAISVPKQGVTPEQVDMIRQGVGSVGRNGNLLLERSDTTALNDKSTYKEFATPKDVDPMLREIGAHPENPKLSRPMEIPKNLRRGLKTEQILEHELGHAVVAHLEGIKVDEIYSHLHPSLKEGGMAAALKVDLDDWKNANGSWNEDKVAKNIDKLITIKMAGGIANELYSGIPFHDNPGVGADVGTARSILRNAGFSTNEIEDKMAAMRDTARNHLTKPGIQSIIKQNAAVREDNLPNTLHYSKDGLQNILRQIGGENDTGRGNEGSVGSSKENDTGRKEADAGNTGQEVPDKGLNPKLSPKGSTVPLMKNPLEIEGTSDSGKINTLDVAKALNQFTKNKLPALELGKAEPAEMVKRAKSIAEDEAKYQLNQNNSGKAWYTTDIGIHDKALQEMRPELKDPAKLSLFKMSEAVLSSGQKPYGNLKAAIRAWDHYNETGEFSPTNPNTGRSWGPRGVDAYGNAMGMINKLIQEKGEQGTSEWLLSEHPVSELRKYNKLGVSGKANDMSLGAMILGEKRGPFAQNLHGIESAFTADMWVSRTWNRWMGTIETDPTGGQTGKGEITTDSPRNNTERQLMAQSFGETAQKLKLSTSALQAVLWYYEQGLYDVHGSAKESWSFADAAKRVQAERLAEEEKQDQGNLFTGEPAPTPEAPEGQIHALDFLKLLGSKK